jgi:hypothetical protein
MKTKWWILQVVLRINIGGCLDQQATDIGAAVSGGVDQGGVCAAAIIKGLRARNKTRGNMHFLFSAFVSALDSSNKRQTSVCPCQADHIRADLPLMK